MKKNIFASFILLYLLTFSFNPQSHNNDWELKKDEDGIKVYTRKSLDSPIKELKIETKVKSSLTSVVALCLDVPAYDDWVYGTYGSKEIKMVNSCENYYYLVSDFPWPMNDRDLVAHSKLFQDPISKIVKSGSISAYKLIPEVKGVVRIKTYLTDWTFKPINKNEVEIIYFLKTNPGNVPPWFVNMALDYGPVQSLKSFREKIKESKYQSAKIDFIKEKY